MAVTVTNTQTSIHPDPLGIFDGLWTVSATLSFASITNSTSDTATITVSGVQLGDQIMSWGMNADPETTIFFYDIHVTANDTVTMDIYNESASPDTPQPTEIKLVIARPSW